ncbi:multidrug DMT transporter permease [Haladaptatus sp. W1]|uniref:DMT family transporter n=1 Tax=Haladaptatus sp. W1 TaxID=1897478 RepID=UPI000849DE79|nr:EamA family transporter [Haladaptatus sp. W1]ODR82329.1 multidrug DMT transporter permease [Haladaptatus sp. W1]
MSDRLGTALVIVSAVGFGTLGILGKLAAGAGLSIPTVLFFRFLLATALVWAGLAVRGRLRRFSGRTLLVGLGLGAFGYAAMSGLYFWGLSFLTAGLVGILLYTYPVIVVVLSALFLDERITRRTGVALVLALVGVALITGGDPAGADPRGIVVVLAAAVVYASYITASRVALDAVPADLLTAHVLPAAACAYLVYGSATGTLSVPDSGSQWLIVAAIAVLATALPIFTFFAGLGRIGASRASIVSTVEPVVTLLLGAAILAEPVTPVTVLGGASVLAGVLLVQAE